MASLFISYSRKDIVFARRLTDCLKEQKMDTWIDWEDIPPAEDWWQQIERGIEETDIFLFLLSPDSAESSVCQREVECAARNGKRLIPVVVREVSKGKQVPQLQQLNYLFFREGDDFDTAFQTLLTSIHTDFEWVQQHRWLQVRAADWKRKNRENGSLLRGGDLRNAELLLAQNSSREPYPTDLQREYVFKSRRALDRQKQIIAVISVIFSCLLACLAAFGFYQARTANARADLILARNLASQAKALQENRSSRRQTAVLLAIRSVQQVSSPDALQVLQMSTLAAPVTTIRHKGQVVSVGFSPNGDFAFSASTDGIVLVWEPKTGRELARFDHKDHVGSAALSQDGRYIAAGGSDKTVDIWELSSRRLIARLVSPGSIYSLLFSPDGRYLLVGTCDGDNEDHTCNRGTAQLFEIGSGREVAHMEHGAIVKALAFSPDSQFAASGACEKIVQQHCTEGTARVWQVSDGQEVSRMIYDGAVNSIAFSPDGTYVASGSTSGGASVWEANTGKVVSHPGQKVLVQSIAFSRDGKYIVSGGWDNLVRVWEAATGKEIARMQHEGPVEVVVFSPDGRQVLSGGLDKTARVWDARTGRELARMTQDSMISALAFSPDGRSALSGSWDYTARVWRTDLLTGGSNASALLPWEKYKVSFQCEDPIASPCRGNLVLVRATVNDIVVSRIRNEIPLSAGEVSPDGSYLAAADEKAIHVWKTASGQEIVSLPYERASNEFILALAFSPDNKLLASGATDRTIRVWEIATGREKRRMTQPSQINAVAFSPDGKYLISGSGTFDRDNTAQIWDVRSGRKLARIEHEYPVRTVAFSQDGKYVVSAGCEQYGIDENRGYATCTSGTARVWEAGSGQEIAHLITHGNVLQAAFSMDDRYILINREEAWLWQADDLIRDACQRVSRNLTRAEWSQYLGSERYQAICPNLPVER